MVVIKCTDPESLDEILFKYGCSSNHRNIDNAVCSVECDDISVSVGHVKYVCEFTEYESKQLFIMSIADAKIDVVYAKAGD